MKPLIVAYVPPPTFGQPGAFLTNLLAFKRTCPLFLWSEFNWAPVIKPWKEQGVDWWVGVEFKQSKQSPEVIVKMGQEAGLSQEEGKKPWVNNLCFYKTVQMARDKGASHIIYLESDCRVGCDNWDQVIIDEAQRTKPNGYAMAGTVVCYGTCQHSHGVHQAWEDLICRYNRKPGKHKHYPIATYGAGAAMQKQDPIVLVNGALGIYSMDWLLQLFGTDALNHTIPLALNSLAWDYEIGKRLWSTVGLKAFDQVAHLDCIYSGYGDVITTEADRKQLLVSGEKVAVHQIKSDWTGLKEFGSHQERLAPVAPDGSGQVSLSVTEALGGGVDRPATVMSEGAPVNTPDCAPHAKLITSETSGLGAVPNTSTLGGQGPVLATEDQYEPGIELSNSASALVLTPSNLPADTLASESQTIPPEAPTAPNHLTAITGQVETPGTVVQTEKAETPRSIPVSGLKMEILYVTFTRDFEWLNKSLASVQNNVMGFMGACVAVPTRDAALFEPLCREYSARLWTFEEWEGKALGFYHHMAMVCSADVICPDADMILHLDPDVIVMEPITPLDYLHEGKPVLVYETFEHIAFKGNKNELHWKSAVDNAIGGDCTINAMCRHPAVHYSDIYAQARGMVAKHNEMEFLDYVKGCRRKAVKHPADFPQRFAEFPVLGAVAHLPLNHGRYHWLRNSTERPKDKVKQFWAGHDQQLTEAENRAILAACTPRFWKE